MKYYIKNFNEKMLNKKFPYYVMGADVGGTNTNIGIAGVKNLKPILLFSLNFKTNELDSIIPAVENALIYSENKYEIKIDLACLGAPGIVSKSNDYARLTNIQWDINSKELIDKTSLKSVYIINDFQTAGYGINLIDLKNSNNILNICSSTVNIESNNTTKAMIGAGTGLGKCLLMYDNKFKAYLPIGSEGGHSDLPVYNDQEIELVNYIKNFRKISEPLTYEEVLSGRGIENIYFFNRNNKEFAETSYTQEIDKSFDKASLISKYKYKDETCKETIRLFTCFYARCAKNYILDTLASGGLYIAGGIAAKNKEIFLSRDFTIEFQNSYRRKEFLKTIPISVILNYDLGLYGACYAAMYRSKKYI